MAPCPTVTSATMSDPRPALTRFQQHFAERIVPLWQGPGWDADMALPYEALDTQHRPLPVQRYRAMACARQLYLFSSRIGQPGAAERAAALASAVGEPSSLSCQFAGYFKVRT